MYMLYAGSRRSPPPKYFRRLPVASHPWIMRSAWYRCYGLFCQFTETNFESDFQPNGFIAEPEKGQKCREPLTLGLASMQQLVGAHCRGLPENNLLSIKRIKREAFGHRQRSGRPDVQNPAGLSPSICSPYASYSYRWRP